MARKHSHKFTIADDDAVRTLVDKLVSVGPQQKVRREKLLRALDDAARHYSVYNGFVSIKNETTVSSNRAGVPQSLSRCLA